MSCTILKSTIINNKAGQDVRVPIMTKDSLHSGTAARSSVIRDANQVTKNL